jgi:hypothetical protein
MGATKGEDFRGGSQLTQEYDQSCLDEGCVRGLARGTEERESDAITADSEVRGSTRRE